jgi:hypothetical protein
MYRVICISSIIILTGCGSLPDLEVGYYLPKSQITSTINQSVACLDLRQKITDDSIWRHHVEQSVSFETSYTANVNEQRFVDLGDIDSWHSKSSFEINYFEDGRISGINSKSAGQIDKVIEKFGTLAATFTGFKSRQEAAPLHPCDIVVNHNLASINPKTNIVTLSITLKGSTDFTSTDNQLKFYPINVNPSDYDILKDVFGTALGKFTEQPLQPQNRVKVASPTDISQQIIVMEPKLFDVKVTIKDSEGNDSLVRKALGKAPHLGNELSIPIQSAPFFGNNDLEVTFHPNGGIKKLGYLSDASASSGFDSLNNLLNVKESNKERLDRRKAEADLIVQNERLANCKLLPKSCT